MSGPFARYAAHMLDGGYSPVPINPRTGWPLVKRWNDLRSRAMSPASIDALVRKYPDLGLAVAGGFQGLIPLDVDTEDEAIVAAICAALPEPTVARVGRKGFAAFYRDPTRTIGGRKFTTAPPARAMLVEVIGTGSLTIPPSLHRVTHQPYCWLTKATLFNTHVDQLSDLTPDHLTRLEAALRPWLPEPRVFVPAPLSSAPVSDRRLQGYARAVLEGEARALQAKPKDSGRNWQLFSAACKLGKFVHHKVLGEDEMARALLGACRANGLLKDDGLHACRATLASGLRKSQRDALPALR